MKHHHPKGNYYSNDGGSFILWSEKKYDFPQEGKFASAPLQVFWRLSGAQFGHPYVTRVYKWHERAM